MPRAARPRLPQTWVLPLHDAADLALAGLRPHQVPRHPPPGRLVRTHDGLVAQALEPAPGRPWPDRPSGPVPPRVLALPTTVDAARGVFAVGGDEAEDLPGPGAPFLVLGPSGSGVSGALLAVASGLGGPVVRVAGSDPPDGPSLLRALDLFGGTVVVDDAHLLAGTRQEEALLAWSEGSQDRLVVGADLEASAGLFRGLVPRVARHRRGLVLRPTSPSHGTLLGVRVPVDDRPVPGRGVLVERGRCTRVQVGRVEAAGGGRA